MAEPIKDELVEVTLSRPYSTNGVTYGYEKQVIDGKRVQVFTGKARVSKADAEDLLSRDATYKAYEDSLHDNNGKVGAVFL